MGAEVVGTPAGSAPKVPHPAVYDRYHPLYAASDRVMNRAQALARPSLAARHGYAL